MVATVSDPLISTRKAHPPASGGSAPGDKSKTSQSSRIHRSTYVVWIVLFYAFLVLYSWIVLCKLTYRPITANHYGYRKQDTHYAHADYAQSFYQRNMRWYKSAQVIQSIATVLTIPLTSAVCSHAVVVYLQHCTGEQTPNVTLRQMLVLTDKGWTSIVTFFHLVTGKWRRYSSPFLVWAIFLHLIGAVISPLLQIFLSTETVKTPTYPLIVQNLPNMLEKIGNTELENESTVATTRKLFASVSPNDTPSLLWSGNNNCTALGEITVDENTVCSQGGNSWSSIPFLSGPFLSPLPKDFNTGLIQQFLPRFNSTATYKRITAEEFPKTCDTTQGALSISRNQSLDYDRGPDPLAWSLYACMPGDLRKSPWKVSRARQDFTEELYLNVSLSTSMIYEINRLNLTAEPYSTYIHITVDTTAGYFELPNYMNAQKAGPILNDDPNATCGESCIVQSDQPTEVHHYGYGDNGQRRNKYSTADDLEQRADKGPLLTTALALFGSDSWIDLAVRYPDLYNHRNDTTDDHPSLSFNCVEFTPLGRILGEATPSSREYNAPYYGTMDKCIHDSMPFSYEHGSEKKRYHNAKLIGEWLYGFRVLDGKKAADNKMADTFTIAAYLANMAWATGDRGDFLVRYDLGADSQKPSISLAGIIVVSICIGLDLLGLLATAVYASWFPRWTELLDAFSVLRLGSSINAHVPLKVSVADDEVEVLDELPGWVGSDVNAPEGEPRGHAIELGGPGRLQTRTDYEAYDGKTARKRAKELSLNEKRGQMSSV